MLSTPEMLPLSFALSPDRTAGEYAIAAGVGIPAAVAAANGHADGGWY